MILLLALAIAPGIAISIFIYFLDKYDKEPLSLLVKSFLLGCLCTVFPLLLQLLAVNNGIKLDPSNTWQTFSYSFIIIGFSEEFAKFGILLIYPFRKKAFNEPYDGIVYSVMIGMGFATAENVAYVLEFGARTAVVRMFLSIPAHACFAIIMGYFIGLAKFVNKEKSLLLAQGIIWPVLLHGGFDFFLLLDKGAYLLIGSLFILFVATRLSIKAVRRHREISTYLHHKNAYNERKDDYIF
ncbi:PrsW family intramembrane metalloprotease [Chitinophaga caeni]|uniref:Protease PrsW n=1 Tax=Chitinophaga caeni TaxID=2029983 RepID=A0A291QVN4_9BACT|nr:PrsW family glutamic-type intramembrane protease [Chitinophaga caeni]ATL47924.1 PrsW family intramembrane metalloprotease [Chitinophaga caeni]